MVPSAGELRVGTVVGGFRVERLLGAGEMGPVYEATQLSLDRRVALRLLPPGGPPAGASVDHPNVVPTYEAGEWEGRRFAVSRLIQGRTLADLSQAGAVSQARFDEIVASVGDALAAAHRAGLVHGRVGAHNVIVDRAGTPFLADLGLGRPGTARGDLDALAALGSIRPPRARHSGKAIAAAVLVGVVAVGVVFLVRGDEDHDADAAPAPRLTEGATALGSDLAPGPMTATGCTRDPDPNTPACILSQGTRAGLTMRVPAAGVIRRWAVRGAAGELTLQVLRRRGGRIVRAGFSQPVRARASDPGVFTADLDVERGDRIGVLLGPGARVGLRERAGGAVRRWEGNRSPLSPSTTVLEGEVLLRADLQVGGRARRARQLTGARAAEAAAGRVLGRAEVEVERSSSVDVRLVRAGRSIAIDTFAGPRRLARTIVPDADVRGRLLELTGRCEYPGAICLQWRNDGDALPLVHAYSLEGGGRLLRVIG